MKKQMKTEAEKAAEWAQSPEGQKAARLAVREAQEYVRQMREAQRLDPGKHIVFTI